MPSMTMRNRSDTERFRSRNKPWRRWVALVLIGISLALAYLALTRDIDWQKRRRETRALGLTAEMNGNHADARRYYETALRNDPYDWETHLSLARVMNHYLNDHDGAIRHYLYALAYAPNPSVAEETEKEIAILRLLRSGELESPLDALEDMFLAVEGNARTVFSRRLSLGIRRNATTYWEAWTKRGRGTPVFCRIESKRDGFFDAMLELNFPDGTAMSMHFHCPYRDIWRLELSFP